MSVQEEDHVSGRAVPAVDFGEIPPTVKRTNSSAASLVAKASTLDPLAQYLNKRFDGPLTASAKAEKIRDILDRYKTVHDTLQSLKYLGWARSTGGYQIPEGEYIFIFPLSYSLMV